MTKTDYRKAVKEVTEMTMYVYPDREETESRSYQRQSNPIIYNNVSSYTQALMKFHEENPTPTKLFNKHLKIQFNEYTPTTKRATTKEVPFIIDKEPTPAEKQQRIHTSPYVHSISNNTGRGGYGGRGYDNSS